MCARHELMMIANAHVLNSAEHIRCSIHLFGICMTNTSVTMIETLEHHVFYASHL